MISGDGRYVAFVSPATNLTGGATAPGDAGCHSSIGLPVGVFVHDRLTGKTALAAPLTAGVDVGYPSLSADGRFIEFPGSDLLPDDPPGILQTYVRGSLHPGRSCPHCARRTPGPPFVATRPGAAAGG